MERSYTGNCHASVVLSRATGNASDGEGLQGWLWVDHGLAMVWVMALSPEQDPRSCRSTGVPATGLLTVPYAMISGVDN